MRRRGNANTWLLGILIAIIGAIGIDVGRRMYYPPKPETPEQKKAEHAPPFKVGGTAPDFALWDDHGQKHALSELVQGDTLVTFTCGCSSCKDMHTYMAKLLAKMGKDAPPVVTITSMPPAGEAAWIRDTKLKQTFLFQPHENSPEEKTQYDDMMRQLKGKDVPNITDLYRGHPCPRIYRMDKGLKVTYIGPSNADAPQPLNAGPYLGYDLARQLQFAGPGEKANGKPLAPQFTTENGPAIDTTTKIPVAGSPTAAPKPVDAAHTKS